MASYNAIRQCCRTVDSYMVLYRSFSSRWIDKGQSAATMDAMIHYAVGIWGIISVLVVASLSMIGVLIGRKVLKKYKK
ncbi:hypothetical protein EFM1CSP_18540 [Enterococcus faecium]|nr:hypothetical protein EFM1CSP_18540 [Enterococcus faecium]